MDTQTRMKINKSAAKEVSSLVNSQGDLTVAMVLDRLYNNDHELLRFASKLHKRRYVDDLLNRKVYRLAVMPYGGLQRRLLIDKFYDALGKCLACLSILEEKLDVDAEPFSLMRDDWIVLSERIEDGMFNFSDFEELFEGLENGSIK